MKQFAFAILCIVVFLLIGCAASPGLRESPGRGLRVADHAFCIRIENKEPAGTGTSFSSTVGRVYLWTVIEGAQGPTSIRHVWYYEDERWLVTPLTITSQRFRTWSYFTIRPDLTGKWHVQVEDRNGNVLGSYPFTIRK